MALIPEIPYDIEVVKNALEKRFKHNRGFAVVVISEGAKPIGGEVSTKENDEFGYHNIRLAGAARRLMEELKQAGFKQEMRETVLGHLQRGGVPTAYDRVLSAQFGVKAFEMALNNDYGKMVSYRHPDFVSVPLVEAISKPNLVTRDNQLVKTAKGLGICLGE